MKKVIAGLGLVLGMVAASNASASDFDVTNSAATKAPVRVHVPGSAEIQIFVNYRSANDYDQKVVSTIESPVSAALVYAPYDVPATNGACYKGEPKEALDLFMQMVSIYNDDTGRSITAWGEPYFDQDLNAVALTIYEKDESGYVNTWFPRMRECVRWATPAERDASL